MKNILCINKAKFKPHIRGFFCLWDDVYILVTQGVYYEKSLNNFIIFQFFNDRL